MSFEKISKLLKGDTPSRSVELHYSRIGPDDAARRCIGQKKATSILVILRYNVHRHKERDQRKNQRWLTIKTGASYKRKTLPVTYSRSNLNLGTYGI
jgi:hypothetical protein